MAVVIREVKKKVKKKKGIITSITAAKGAKGSAKIITNFVAGKIKAAVYIFF